VEDFEAAAMPHFADLYRTARLLAQDRAEGEDLVQEVYLEAWKSFHRFQAGTNCRAWLFKILFHRLHHFRRRWAKAAKVEAFENAEDQDSLIAETPVQEEIRDEDVLQALAARGVSRIARNRQRGISRLQPDFAEFLTCTTGC
jgi:RNA polymerase sigma-70 factor (ECF subfamily)